MDEPVFPGCLLRRRLIGIIQGEQGRKKDCERNDRIAAIEEENHRYARVEHIKDLGKEFVEELEGFFLSYPELSGKQYRILDVRGPKEVERRIRDGMRGIEPSRGRHRCGIN